VNDVGSPEEASERDEPTRVAVVPAKLDDRDARVRDLVSERITGPKNRQHGVPVTTMSAPQHPDELTLRPVSGHPTDDVHDPQHRLVTDQAPCPDPGQVAVAFEMLMEQPRQNDRVPGAEFAMETNAAVEEGLARESPCELGVPFQAGETEDPLESFLWGFRRRPRIGP
jgi:hypothetical protein